MKYQRLILGIMAGFFFLPPGLFGQVFQTLEYQKALSLAAEKQQFIWLNFHSSADELCVQMDASVFSNPQIQSAARSFVSIRMDANSSDGQNLMARFRISQLPSSLFVNSAGEEVERISGYLAAPFFLQKIKKIRSGVDTFAALEKEYARDPMNGELAFQLAKKRVLMGRKLAAIELFENVLTLDSFNSCGCLPEVYFNLGTLALAINDSELAEYYWTILVQDFPDSKFAVKIMKRQPAETRPERKAPAAEPVVAVSEHPEKSPQVDSIAIASPQISPPVDRTVAPIDTVVSFSGRLDETGDVFSENTEKTATADSLTIPLPPLPTPTDSTVTVIATTDPVREILDESGIILQKENIAAPVVTIEETPNDSAFVAERDFVTVSVSFDLDSTALDYEPEVAVIWQDSIGLDTAKANFPTVTVIGVDTSVWDDTPIDWDIEPENTVAADSFEYYLAQAAIFLNSSRSQEGLRQMVRAYQLAPDNVANLKRMAEMAMLFEIHGNAPVYWAAQAVELTEHKVAELLHVLAEMYAMNSLYTAAIKVEREALDVADNSDPKRLYAKRIQEWQQLEKAASLKEKK